MQNTVRLNLRNPDFNISLILVITVSMVFIVFLNPQQSSAQSSSASAGAGASSGGASAASSATAGGVIISNQPATINKNVITSLVRTAQGKVITNSPCATPCVDLETVRLGKSVFASNGLRPLSDVIPFRIIGGHVSLTSPKNIKLVAATITGRGIEHAVILDLIKVRDVKAGQSLFQTDLGEVISGTNLFTNRQDTVSNFTDLLLWNNSNAPIFFNDDDQSAITIIFR
jgi:hypothetical protein